MLYRIVKHFLFNCILKKQNVYFSLKSTDNELTQYR
ncbi:hypothetical protein C8C85_3728 [Flavobacterium sp. 103]|nr:hypothetical protein C8C85_3728 [Flavobacterium sp. 103]